MLLLLLLVSHEDLKGSTHVNGNTVNLNDSLHKNLAMQMQEQEQENAPRKLRSAKTNERMTPKRSPGMVPRGRRKEAP